jgi:hypothetical protein
VAQRASQLYHRSVRPQASDGRADFAGDEEIFQVEARQPQITHGVTSVPARVAREDPYGVRIGRRRRISETL